MISKFLYHFFFNKQEFENQEVLGLYSSSERILNIQFSFVKAQKHHGKKEISLNTFICALEQYCSINSMLYKLTQCSESPQMPYLKQWGRH